MHEYSIDATRTEGKTLLHSAQASVHDMTITTKAGGGGVWPKSHVSLAVLCVMCVMCPGLQWLRRSPTKAVLSWGQCHTQCYGGLQPRRLHRECSQIVPIDSSTLAPAMLKGTACSRCHRLQGLPALMCYGNFHVDLMHLQKSRLAVLQDALEQDHARTTLMW